MCHHKLMKGKREIKMNELIPIIPFEGLPLWILIIVIFLFAFGITFYVIPKMINVANLRNIYAKPNERTSHYKDTPNIGGFAIFLAFILSSILIAGSLFKTEMFYIIAALTIIFFTGIKDDLIAISPSKKLIAQILAAFILTIFADIRIGNLFYILNFGYISYLVSIFLTIFIFIFIINGFNLIDGIDGLSSGAGILSSLVFGIFFLKIGNSVYSLICFSFLGTLTAFFIFNFFGTKNKTFLGDSGSMLIGIVISIMAIKFINSTEIISNYFIEQNVSIAIGVLILPIYDTLRVFTLRIFQGKSPFKADKQHLHHNLLNLELSHIHATLILLSTNIFFIIMSYSFQSMGNLKIIIIMFTLCILLSYILKRYVTSNLRKRLFELTKKYPSIYLPKREKIAINDLNLDSIIEYIQTIEKYIDELDYTL